MFNTLLFGVGLSQFHLSDIDNEKLSKFKEQRYLDTSDTLLSELNSRILKEGKYILNSTCKSKELYIKKIWCNYNVNKDIEEPHNHRNSFLSAIYYPLSTDGVIQFFSPFSDYFLSQVPIEDVYDMNCYNSSFYELPVRSGDLIIFNSMLYHRAKLSANERISIAYDINIKSW
tara:strand:- start:85 stop:603 length:519 start_codon:yes stop_codon:yes gene_type:complete